MQSPNLHNPDDSLYRSALNDWQAGEVARAEARLTELLTRNPTHGQAATLLAKLYQAQGRLSQASRVAAQHCRQSGSNAESTVHWAQFIQQCQRQDVAVQLCEEAIGLGHGSAELYGLAGNMLCELGKFDAARHHLLTAVEHGIDLNRWFVYGALADTRHYTHADDPDIARLQAHFHEPGATAQARAATGFALAKIHDDLGDYARAANNLREANALARQVMPWSRQSWRDRVAHRIRQTVRASVPAQDRGITPVFVVGMPRTGTTLTASQLGKYAHVRDRGEMPHIGYIARRLADSNCLNDPDALHEAADLYYAHIRQDDAPARWYIDKNPENIRYLDLVAAMFPQARIILCRRRAADTALSMWSRYFAHADQAYSYDFDDISAFMSGNDELVDHWRRHLAAPLFTLDYEQLATQPTESVAQLGQFIGLEGEPVRDSPGGGEAIASNSRWQARQPIHASSIGRWKRYLPFIPELEAFSHREE